jgi:hypothetical protein
MVAPGVVRLVNTTMVDFYRAIPGEAYTGVLTEQGYSDDV